MGYDARAWAIKRTSVHAAEKEYALLAQAEEWRLPCVRPGGWLVMEISGTVAERVRGLLAEWNEVEITNDLQGIPRVASARIA